ncbi:DinB family protein [Kitasatospora sp. LaBMicrA B282]|uniref:DinB family protein n=1 Tax=Kitasatospora sp. LaBMicrA B282 TaxID=3420949 RepID=UPI003D0BB4C1
MPIVVRAENDERDALLTFLAAQRGGLHRALLGLTDEQASATPLPSTLSLAGLIKHSALVERNWISTILMGRPADPAAGPEQWADQFRLLPGETLAQWLTTYEEVAAETEKIIGDLPSLDFDSALPNAPWFPAGARRTARWILLHLIEESGRHAGHADLIREAIDGKTAFELVAAADAADVAATAAAAEA